MPAASFGLAGAKRRNVSGNMIWVLANQLHFPAKPLLAAEEGRGSLPSNTCNQLGPSAGRVDKEASTQYQDHTAPQITPQHQSPRLTPCSDMPLSLTTPEPLPSSALPFPTGYFSKIHSSQAATNCSKRTQAPPQASQALTYATDVGQHHTPYPHAGVGPSLTPPARCTVDVPCMRQCCLPQTGGKTAVQPGANMQGLPCIIAFLASTAPTSQPRCPLLLHSRPCTSVASLHGVCR